MKQAMERINGLTGFLLEHGEKKPVSFHMPGHKGAELYRRYGYGDFLDAIMDCDITEIPGADNLFQPEDVIQGIMTRYACLYQAKSSYLLVNGSSGGLIAAILTAVPRGGKLILARNCHKSIFNALSIGDIRPVYAYPEEIEDCGILGGVSPGEVVRCMEENPDAVAVIIPSPNYYGICSDVAAIAEEVHKRGKVLIVDQAHGAHLKFFAKYTAPEECSTPQATLRDSAEVSPQAALRNSSEASPGVSLHFPPAAEEQGADVVINSIHKTLASFTQTALLNVCSERIDCYDLEDRLQMIESSSPSYPLMASLEINCRILEKDGPALIQAWAEDLAWFYQTAPKAVPGLKLMTHPALDPTKLNLDLSAYGIGGNQLEEELMKRNIFIELVTGNLVMCMTGIGNRRCDYQRLIQALKEIAEEAKATGGLAAEKPKQPKAVVKPLKLEAVPVRKERILLADAAGRVCATSVIPYPPGIPMVCPGEVFDEEVIAYIADRRRAGEKVIGVDQQGRVAVGAPPASKV